MTLNKYITDKLIWSLSSSDDFLIKSLAKLMEFELIHITFLVVNNQIECFVPSKGEIFYLKNSSKSGANKEKLGF